MAGYNSTDDRQQEQAQGLSVQGEDIYNLTDPEEIQKVAQEISSLIDRRMERARRNRWQFERQWLKNILFYAGHQWVICDDRNNRWRRKKMPAWIPTPVTNVVAEKADDNITSLVQQIPTLSFAPETASAEDIATAEIADRINEVIAEESGRDRTRNDVAAWSTITGCAFVESFYDNDPRFGEIFLHYDQCGSCGFTASPEEFPKNGETCPQCGSTDVTDAFDIEGAMCSECGLEGPAESVGAQCPQCALAAQQFALEQEAMQLASMTAIEQPGDAPVGPMAPPPAPAQPQLGMDPGMDPGMQQMMPPEPPPIGVMKLKFGREPQGRMVPRGKLRQKVRSPFEVFYDMGQTTRFEPDFGLEWCITIDLMDEERAKMDYGHTELKGGGTHSGVGIGTSVSILQSLTALANDAGGMRESMGRGGGNTAPVLRENYHQMPSPRFPRGLIAVRVGGTSGKVVKWGESPYHYSNGEPMIPVTHFPFRIQTGRCPGKPPIADIIPLQELRNKTECRMILAEERMTNGAWLLPRGITDTEPTGMPGELVYYNLYGEGSGRQAKPERVPGIEPAAYFRYRIEQLDRDIEKLAGSFGVAHGEAPQGITAASALQLLGERQQRAVSTQVNAFEQAYERLAIQQLEIFREYATEPRVKAAQAPNSSWKLQQWSGADLSGRVTVRVERGSALPKSNAQERASVEMLGGMGIIDVTDPRVRNEIVRLFGLGGIMEHQNIDIADARKEQERFLRLCQNQEGGELPEFREEIDDHPTHLSEHVTFMKSDEYREIESRAKRLEGIDPFARAMVTFFETHLAMHKKAVQDALMAEQAMMAGGGEDSGRPPGRPAGTGSVYNRGARAPQEEAQRSISEPAPVGV